jgi:membrane dipeptidase
MKLIDLHCDTAYKLLQDPVRTLARNDLAVDLDALENVRSMAQVFALFVDQGKTASPAGTAHAMLDRLRAELEANGDRIAFAGNGAAIRENEKAGRMSALVGMEEGGALEGSLDALRAFYAKGVRFITLTWNYPNEIGFPHGAEYGQKGLTPFGLELLAELDRLGVIADVSHLSEGGFRDVAERAQGPFMATHSNCRALKDHTRNLTDAQIRVLADKGGVMGLCVAKNFLLEGEDSGRLEAMVRHIEHARNAGGIDVLAIGGDFDGTALNHELRRIDDLNKLEPLLRKAGYTDGMLERIYWQNALRVIDAVL